MRDGTITLMSRVWMCERVSPVVRSLWQRTDAALLLRTHNRTPCCLSRLWRWRRSCSPRARVQSPGIQGPLFYQPANRKSKECNVTVTGGRRQNSPPISHRWSWCPTRKCWSRSSVCVCLGTEQLRPYPGGRWIIHSLMIYLYILCTPLLLQQICVHICVLENIRDSGFIIVLKLAEHTPRPHAAP